MFDISIFRIDHSFFGLRKRLVGVTDLQDIRRQSSNFEFGLVGILGGGCHIRVDGQHGMLELDWEGTHT